eukprot:g39571.t1
MERVGPLKDKGWNLCVEPEEVGEAPEDRRIVNIVPLFKTGSRDNPGHYRPDVMKMIDERNMVDVVYMEFSKEFHKVNHGRLLQKWYQRRGNEYKDKQVMLQLYRTLIRPHLEHCIQFWSPHYQKDVDALER